MRILSGIQPSGIPHLGNYFGMMRPAISMQDQGETFLFIADYHALTGIPAPEDLRQRVFNVALDFLACGLDPSKTVFYRQSDIVAIPELAWILSCSTSMGLLERAHSYKDKLAHDFVPNTGLFFYPVLMAADILMFKAQAVPVGKDQKQHLEITRDIAQRFNREYGEILVVPRDIIQESVAVIPGTDGQKMSKSYNNTIPIFGKEKQIRKAVMSIVTDSKGMEEVKDPATCNIVTLYRLLASPEQVAEMEAHYRSGNYGYGHAKQALFELIWEYFAPFRKHREELEKDPGYVWQQLEIGKNKALAVADQTMAEVRRAIGVR